MILWVIAVVGFCILVQLIRSRDQFLDVRRPGDRFGQAAVVILIAGGLAYDSTLVGGSPVIQVVIVAGVLVATVGQLATAGRSNPSEAFAAGLRADAAGLLHVPAQRLQRGGHRLLRPARSGRPVGMPWCPADLRRHQSRDPCCW